jgi:hypothetical protein
MNVTISEYRVMLAVLVLVGIKNVGTEAPPLSIGGTYDTRVTLIANGCPGTVVKDNPTTVTQTAGDTLLTLTHAVIRSEGVVHDDGSFRMTPSRWSMSAVEYSFAIEGLFTQTGFTAGVRVTRTDSTSSRHCEYTVRWVGSKLGAPNVIPGQ